MMVIAQLQKRFYRVSYQVNNFNQHQQLLLAAM